MTLSVYSIYHMVAIAVVICGSIVSTIVYIVRKTDKIKFISERMPELLALMPRVDELESKQSTGFEKLDANRLEIQKTKLQIEDDLKEVKESNSLILESIYKLANNLDNRDVIEGLDDKTMRVMK